MNYRFFFFIFCMLGVCYSQQISAISSCLEAVNGGLRTEILKDNGRVREEYVGRKGYALFAEDRTEAQMQKAFKGVSSALGKAEFAELDWQGFHGIVSEFWTFRNKIFNGRVREEYVGRNGYVLFSEKYMGGKMQKTFMNVSSVLDKVEFQKLGWQQFQGIASEFRTFRNKILKGNGRVREEYVGRKGYVLFSDRWTEGNMQKSFMNVSAVLNKAEFAKLDWQQFQGTVAEFRAFRDKILRENGRMREEYVGRNGYVLFSEKYMDGQMQKAFINVSSVLDKVEFQKLDWQHFQGTVSEFRVLRDKIVKDNGRMREEYVGMEGYALFAEKYMDGQMQKAFQNVSSVLDKVEFQKLGWQQFQGTVSEFRVLRDKIFKENGRVREEYVGMKGYALFAEDRTEAKMQKAFQNVSSVLDKVEFQKLDWQQFQGTVSEFRAFRDKILNKEESVREGYVGMEGYALFAEKYMDGQMPKTFRNVSSVLDKVEFQKLDWQGFQGTVSEFRVLRDKIVKENGRLREEYVGMEGYALFAEKYMDGQMQKAYQNMSAVLDKAGFADLGWKKFQGTVVQFHALLEDFIEHYPEGYKGLEGQQRLANQIFKGDKLITYRNVSVLRGYFFGEGKGKDGKFIKHREFRVLDWIIGR